VLSGSGLCDGPITRTEESYRLWRVVVCVLETSIIRRPLPTVGGGAFAPETNITLFKIVSAENGCCGRNRLGY